MSPAKKTDTAPLESRESWMVRALPDLKARLAEAGGKDFADPLLSMGLPSESPLGGKRQRIGECWTERCTGAGKRCTIFMSPVLRDPLQVLDVLIHELVHASVGNKCGHKGAFKALALGIGLTGPMRSTEAGPELKKFLEDLIKTLGPFHHEPLTNFKDPRKRQTTRQRLYECSECGKKIRVASDTFLATHFCEDSVDGKAGMFVLKSSPNLEE